MRIYLASRFSRKDELRGYAQQLERMGHSVTSRWLYGEHDVADEYAMTVEEQALFAAHDLMDIEHADMLIAFTEPAHSDASRGGRHVELGYALARQKRVIVIGYRENIFCCLPGVLYLETWQDLVTVLQLRDEGRAA